MPKKLEEECKVTVRYAPLIFNDFLVLMRPCSLSLVKKLIKKGRVKTVRNSGLSSVDKGEAILRIAEQDPLGRFGCRLTKEKLALEGTHISRCVSRSIRRPESCLADERDQ